MKRTTFCAWLLRHVKDDNPVGDLARDFAADMSTRKVNPGNYQWANGANTRRKFPQHSCDFRDWWNYLQGTNAEDTLVSAFEDWMSFVKEVEL